MSMVQLIINSNTFQADKNANLLETLIDNGYMVPHFCYHRELGIDGNCRMCLVEVKGKKRPQIACHTPIVDGMEVFTKSNLTQYVQKSVMELELVNHPVDCPECDQAGECSLQDYYMAHDKEESRTGVKKVQKEKRQNLGSGVIYDAERCILCTRCVRFTEKITKTNELGVFKRGDESRIMTFANRKISNKYSQGIVDVCPVGAMTSEDFRFEKRVWHLQSTKAACQECAKNCSIFVESQRQKKPLVAGKKYISNTYEEKIYRIRPRVNPTNNGHFMCDLGRYVYKLENGEGKINLDYSAENEELKSKKKVAKRVLTPQINGMDITFEKAMLEIAHCLREDTLFLVSPSLSLEELFMLRKLAQKFNCHLSAFSPSYIKEDGDGYLIQSDKAANRASVRLLGIDEGQPSCQTIEMVFNFNSKEIDNILFKEIEIVDFLVSQKAKSNARFTLPIASRFERSGLFINCDDLVQDSKAAVAPKCQTLCDIVGQLLGESPNMHNLRGEISKDLQYNFSNIPANGAYLSTLKIETVQKEHAK